MRNTLTAMADAVGEPTDFARARAIFTALRAADQVRCKAVLDPLDEAEPQIARAVRLMLDADRDEPTAPFATPLCDVAAAINGALDRDDSSGQATPTPSHTIDFGPRYRVLSYIGHGSAGEVHLAEQRHPVQRQVALKLFPWSHPTASERRRFEREALALARLTHPGIAQVHEAATTPDGRLFLAMEFVPGQPIDRSCDDLGIGAARRIGLIVQVCEAVEHAHQRGVIHRDLKPNNILVTGSAAAPIAKVIDFGIARLLDDDSAAGRTLTRPGDVVGTLDYMSPEQREGRGGDRRSDVYALGVLLLTLVKGRGARASAPARLASLHGGADLPTDVGLPRRQRVDLASILRMATAADVDDRYSTPKEMADDLRRLLDDRPVQARHTGRMTRALRLWRRHPILTVLIASTAAALLALTTMLVQSRSSLAVNRDQLESELSRNRTLTIELLDDVLDRLYPVVGAGEARRALTAMLLDHTSDLLELQPTDLDLREAHARLVVELGNQEFELVRLDDALALRLEAVLRFDDLAALQPETIPLRRRHAEAIVRLGDALVELRRVAEGRETHRRAHTILETLAQQHPTHVGILDDLTWSLDRLWTNEDLETDPERPMELVQSRLALAERLVALDSKRALSRFTLMDGHRQHARVLAHLGQHAESLAASARAIAIGNALVDEAPHILHYRVTLALATMQASEVAGWEGDDRRRLDLLLDADRISAELIAQEPDHQQALDVREVCVQHLLHAPWPDEAPHRHQALLDELSALRARRAARHGR